MVLILRLKSAYLRAYIRRNYSTSPDPGKAYAKTLRLPKPSIPLWSEPHVREAPFREKTTQALYNWQWKNVKGDLFVMHDGPPYANGNLHMGHALNRILKDVINRFNVLQGRRVNFIPGWDCHGLPIENKATKDLGAEPHTLSPQAVRDAARATATEQMNCQREEMMKFGLMADWTDAGCYRTMDHDYEIRQLRIFQGMVEKGLIYRNYRPVHWSPSSRTALAAAELTYQDNHISRTVYVKFTVDCSSMPYSLQQAWDAAGRGPLSLLIWTTTPWTLPANLAIAVNSDLDYLLIKVDNTQDLVLVCRDRLPALQKVIGPSTIEASVKGSEIVGIRYYSLFDQTAPLREVLPAHYVSSDSGTGLVHTAPAHGAEDYNLFLARGLVAGITCAVDAEGRFTSEIINISNGEVGRRLLGKEVLYQGTKEIINILQESGHLVAEEKIKHKYPYDWKTDKPIIVRATSQWFANVDVIKDTALKMLGEVTFHPASSGNLLESYIKERFEWCISRQRHWGVPIPVLYNKVTEQPVLASDSLSHIISILEQKGTQHWYDGPIEEFIPPSLADTAPSTLCKGTDTMDIWFDSGTAWSILASRGVRTPEDSPLADVCLEGTDQHRGWFQSLLLTAAASGIKPYGTLITHGYVVDQDGKKMSKSLGNVISPITIIEGGKDKAKEPAYGADVLRLWAASVEYTREMAIGPKVLSQAAESLRKIRNTARFILGNIGLQPGDMTMDPLPRTEMNLAERYIMHQLYSLEQNAKEAYADYDFPKVVTTLTHFANITLSSLYFDITKDTLYADAMSSPERRAVITVFHEILNTIVPIMAPIVPHLAEEIHQANQEPNDLSVFSKGWKEVDVKWKDPTAHADMQLLLSVRERVLDLLEKARRMGRMKSSLEAEVVIVIPRQERQIVTVLQEQEKFLKTLFIVSDAELITEGNPGSDGVSLLHPMSWSLVETPTIQDTVLKIYVRQASLHKCPRCWTYTRKEDEILCRRCADICDGHEKLHHYSQFNAFIG